MRSTIAALLATFLLGSAAATQAQDRGYTWLIDRHTYALEPDGRWTGLIEVERKAHDAQAARDGARIDLSYPASQQKIEILEAVTVKADGRRLPVDKGKIFDIAPQVAREVAHYTDLRTRSIVFPDVESGDSIRYVYRLITFDLTWPGFSWHGSWNRSARAILSERIIDHPASLRLADEHHGIDYRVETTGDRVRRIFSWTNRTTVDDEAGATSRLDWGPRFAISSHGSYAEIGDHYGGLHADSSAVTADIVLLANEIVGSTTDSRAQARLVYDWVARNIRYVAVSVGQGKLTPTVASDTVRNRYGDCKAHAALLAALLAARGIASEPALMNANVPHYTLPDTPVAAFNHVILHVPGLDLYLDPTWQYGAFGVLPWAHYDKPVLHAVVGKSRLKRIPAEKTSDNLAETHIEATVSFDGRITGLTRETARGVMAADLRRLAVDTSVAKATAQLRHFGSPGTGKWIQTIKDPSKDQAELLGDFELSDQIDLAAGEALWAPTGLRFFVRPGAFLVGVHDTPRKRPFPCHAGRQVEIIEVTLPADLQPSRLPADKHWKTSIAEYRATYTFSESTLRVRREFIATPEGQVCRPEHSQELVGLLSNIRRDLRAVVVFGQRS